MDLNHHLAISHQQRLLAAAERQRARRPRRRARALARALAPGDGRSRPVVPQVPCAC